MGDFNEGELVSRCRTGDERAFRELIDHYKDLVFALIARIGPDPARAEDLAQDVFLRVHRGLPYFRGEARLSTWIYRIVANLCAQERARRPFAEISLDESDEEGRPRRDPGALDASFSDLELRDRLDKAIKRLPVQHGLLVAGHYLKGMQYEELAEALDIPIGTVKTQLHRAKRRLRRMLEEEL